MKKPEYNKKNSTCKSEGLSRRDFLKNAGLVTGGIAVTSMAIAAGCTDGGKTTTPTTTPPATTSPTTTPTTTAPTSTVPTTTPTTTPPTTTGNGGFVYMPPASNPELVDVVGCTSKVAADRLYSEEHVWVKLIEDNLAVIGMTDKMQLLLGLVERGELVLNPVGTELVYDGWLGNFEGQKMNVDMYSPVSGIIIQVNDELYVNSRVLESEPYLRGWLYVIELSRPEELDNLLDPIEYATAQANPNA